MARRLFNPKTPKIHRNYTVEELATAYNTHRNTVRQWIKQGLPVCNKGKPMLIMGSDAAEFHTARRRATKRPCKPGEIYCMRCRKPKIPTGSAVRFESTTATLGTFIGTCPSCSSQMYRRTSLRKLDQAKGDLRVTFTKAKTRISDTARSLVNTHLQHGAATHE